jgi:hypothetical protein
MEHSPYIISEPKGGKGLKRFAIEHPFISFAIITVAIILFLIFLIWAVPTAIDCIARWIGKETYLTYDLWSHVNLGDKVAKHKRPKKMVAPPPPPPEYVETAPVPTPLLPIEKEPEAAIEAAAIEKKELVIFEPEEEMKVEVPLEIPKEIPTPIPLPPIFEQTGKTRGVPFVVYPGYDIPGHTSFTFYRKNVSPDFLDVCFSLGSRCKAFNTHGEFKNYFDPALLVPRKFERDLWLGDKSGLIVRAADI